MKRGFSKVVPNGRLKVKLQSRGNQPKRMKPRRKPNPEEQAAVVTASALNRQHMENKLQDLMVSNQTDKSISFVSILNSSVEIPATGESQDPFGDIGSQDMLADPYSMGNIFESQHSSPKAQTSCENYKLAGLDVVMIKPPNSPPNTTPELVLAPTQSEAIDVQLRHDTPELVPKLVEPPSKNSDLVRARAQNKAVDADHKQKDVAEQIPESCHPPQTITDLPPAPAQSEAVVDVSQPQNDAPKLVDEDETDTDSEDDSIDKGKGESYWQAKYEKQKANSLTLRRQLKQLKSDKVSSDNLALRQAKELQALKDKQQIPMATFTTMPGIRLSVKELEELNERANSDSMFVGLLCINLVSVERLKKMSVTGQPSHRYINSKAADGSPLYASTEKLDPKLLTFICDKLAERVAIKVGPANSAFIRAAADEKLVKRYIAQKISNLKKCNKGEQESPESSKSSK